MLNRSDRLDITNQAITKRTNLEIIAIQKKGTPADYFEIIKSSTANILTDNANIYQSKEEQIHNYSETLQEISILIVDKDLEDIYLDEFDDIGNIKEIKIKSNKSLKKYSKVRFLFNGAIAMFKITKLIKNKDMVNLPIYILAKTPNNV